MSKYLKSIASFIFICAATFLLTEAAYRYYLAAHLRNEVASKYKPPDLSNISAYGVPPWRFDAKQGFVFQETPWLYAHLKDQAFYECNVAARASRYGNLGDDPDAYKKASVRLAILGSSYSLVTNAKKQYVTEVLSEDLTRRFGRSVQVLNYSRDATGVLTSFDIADAVVDQIKPDAFIILMNVTAFAYPRHWRRVFWDEAGFGRLYFIKDPTKMEKLEDLGPPHLQVITRQVNDIWCAKMTTAKKNGQLDIMKNDPIVKAILTQLVKLQKERTLPTIDVDFTRLDISFIYKLLVHRDPFYNVRLFKPQSSNNSFNLAKFSDDPRFRSEIAHLKNLNIPILLVHIPTLIEMRTIDGGFAYAAHGVSPELGKSLKNDLENVTGHQFIHLFDLYSPEAKSDPLKLVQSEQDSHPSPAGVDAMAQALANLLAENAQTRSLFLEPQQKQ